MAKSSQINMAVLASILAITAGWATWVLFWPFGLAAYVPLLAVASRKGLKPAVACVALSPFLLVPVVFTVVGAHAFLQGTAVIMVRGQPTVESTNLDSRHRVPLVHPPRGADARHDFGWLAYEAGVRLMGSIAGPMDGAYTGPYPGRMGAWRSLDAAKNVEVKKGQVFVGKRYTTLPPELRTELLRALYPNEPARPPLRAHRLGETLVVGRPDQLWLIQENTGEIFAIWRRPRDQKPVLNWPKKATAVAPVSSATAVRNQPRAYASPAY